MLLHPEAISASHVDVAYWISMAAAPVANAALLLFFARPDWSVGPSVVCWFVRSTVGRSALRMAQKARSGRAELGFPAVDSGRARLFLGSAGVGAGGECTHCHAWA